MTENKKGFNNIDMTENERLAHLTMHLSHALRFGRKQPQEAVKGSEGGRPNPGVGRILEIAAHNPKLTVEKAQGILGTSEEGMAELTGKMTEHGLIAIEGGVIALTEKGAKIQAEAAENSKRTADELFGALSADEQETLKALYEKLIAAWHEGE